MTGKTRIAIGCDHAGFELKEKVRAYLAGKGYQIEDLGTHSTASVDYPDYAEKVAVRVVQKQAEYGVLVCGTGIGIGISANKVPGIRAATCNDTLSARFARSHNDANVLTLGGRIIDASTAEKILETWLSTPFEGGRHQRRLDKITALEQMHPQEKKS